MLPLSRTGESGGWGSGERERGRSQGLHHPLSRGPDFTPALQDGWTPLYLAACNGHTAVARLLVEAGASAVAAREIAAEVGQGSESHFQSCRLPLQRLIRTLPLPA